jgi:hypothetical protein
MQPPTDQTKKTDQQTKSDQADQTRADALDDALDRLSGYSFADGPGMAAHGTMGAEALSAAGHDHAVANWVEGYKTRHEPIPAPPLTDRLDPADPTSWQEALGDPSRLSDWHDLFSRQLEDQRWQEVVSSWGPRLLPGYGGAFTHGLIRTAHAVRGLESGRAPSSLRIDELAKGLAYWAGTYKALPGRPSLQGGRSLGEALAGIPRPEQAWTPIEAGMFARIHELDGFTEAVEALGPPPSIDDALSDLTATFARMMLANPDVHPFGLVHALTPVAGARTLLPYLPTVSIEQLYAQLWHVDAAITASFVPSTSDDLTRALEQDAPPPPDELAGRAAEHGDPHVVKFTEACTREDALRPDPNYLLAARHVADRTPAW